MNNETNKNNERFIQKPPSIKLFALNIVPAFLIGRTLSPLKNQKPGKDKRQLIYQMFSIIIQIVNIKILNWFINQIFITIQLPEKRTSDNSQCLNQGQEKSEFTAKSL